MKPIVSSYAIVLTRVNFQEADRIITVLTPGHGKVRVIAKGVRKSKSKMAGGVELFSINELQFMPGKGDIGTLRSSRLHKHFAEISKNITKTMLAYECLRVIHKATEDAAEDEYYNLLAEVLHLLNVSDKLQHIELWFLMNVLALQGRAPELHQDQSATALKSTDTFAFNYDDMSFAPSRDGQFSVNHIKLLRAALRFSGMQFIGIKTDDVTVSTALNHTKKIIQY